MKASDSLEEAAHMQTSGQQGEGRQRQGGEEGEGLQAALKEARCVCYSVDSVKLLFSSIVRVLKSSL